MGVTSNQADGYVTHAISGRRAWLRFSWILTCTALPLPQGASFILDCSSIGHLWVLTHFLWSLDSIYSANAVGDSTRRVPIKGWEKLLPKPRPKH